MLDMQESVAERRSGYYNELAERARYDKEAFSELYDYFFPRVYNFIFAKVKNTEQADDIISITFEKVFVKLGDPKEGIIVNVGGIKSSRFLKVGITVELNPDREDNLAEGKLTPVAETKIMDTTLQIIRTVKVEELDAARQDDLKAKLKAELNKALGEGSVYDIYITSFMLQ